MKRGLLPAWISWPRLDLPLLAALLTVMGGGLLVLYSASGEDMNEVIRQSIRMGAGLVALLVLSLVPLYKLSQGE